MQRLDRAIVSGFGQDSAAVAYMLDGNPINQFVADEILQSHLSRIEKNSRHRTKEQKPCIAYTKNGTYAHYSDDKMFRVEDDGSYTEITASHNPLIGPPFIRGGKDGLRISGDHEIAEAIRHQLVPRYYDACLFRAVTVKPYDHLTEETPLYVGCKHIEFRRSNYGECLGQCVLVGQRYGR